MAWLHSPFTKHQGLGEGGSSNLRKGYKVSSSNDDCDPDNCDTPLLFDAPPPKTEQKSLNSDWFGNMSLASKNQAVSKSSLTTSLFHSSNTKPQTSSSSQEVNVVLQPKKHTEGKNLLNHIEKKKEEFQMDEDDESEDEWCVPKSGGYHKVRSGTD